MAWGGGEGCRRAWDSFGLSQVAIIINSLFLTNDRVFALPRIKGAWICREKNAINFSYRRGRTRSVSRTFSLRCLNGDPANRVPDISMDGAKHPRSSLPPRSRPFHSSPFPFNPIGMAFLFSFSPVFFLFPFRSFFFFYLPSFIILQQLVRPEYLPRQDLIVEFFNSTSINNDEFFNSSFNNDVGLR